MQSNQQSQRNHCIREKHFCLWLFGLCFILSNFHRFFQCTLVVAIVGFAQGSLLFCFCIFLQMRLLLWVGQWYIWFDLILFDCRLVVYYFLCFLLNFSLFCVMYAHYCILFQLNAFCIELTKQSIFNHKLWLVYYEIDGLSMLVHVIWIKKVKLAKKG